MKREEEIEKSVYDYSKKIEERMNGFDYFNYEHIEHAFIDGIEWADANPKNPWISVEDDLPCNHDELFINDDKKETKTVLSITNGYIMMNRMYKPKRKWRWISEEQPTHWMPIPELPKE